MSGRHSTTERPVTGVSALPGHPRPGDVLRAAAATLPTTDPRGYLLALSHLYDEQEQGHE